MRSSAFAPMPFGGSAYGQLQQATQFTDATGNPPIQRIEPDALFSITVFNAPESARRVRVSPEGSISHPVVGRSVEVTVPAFLAAFSIGGAVLPIGGFLGRMSPVFAGARVVRIALLPLRLVVIVIRNCAQARRAPAYA